MRVGGWVVANRSRVMVGEVRSEVITKSELGWARSDLDGVTGVTMPDNLLRGALLTCLFLAQFLALR